MTRAACIRALCALLAALFLLLLTHFSVFRLLAGPRQLEAVTAAELGAYTVRDIDCILDFYAEETAGGTVTARYAVVPQGGMLVTYLLPSGSLDAAEAVLHDTTEWLNGRTETRTQRFTVSGTVAQLDPDVEDRLYQWFSEAQAQLRAAGVIGASADYADHLSPYVILVGRAGPMASAAVWALSAPAALCIAYAAAVFVRAGTGKYRDAGPREVTKT